MRVRRVASPVFAPENFTDNDLTSDRQLPHQRAFSPNPDPTTKIPPSTQA